jgi:hypothetical protein
MKCGPSGFAPTSRSTANGGWLHEHDRWGSERHWRAFKCVDEVPVRGQGSLPLVAEESENMAFGFTYRPRGPAGLKVSLNYFDIDYTDRIQMPPFDEGVLGRRDEPGEVISDFASDAEAQVYPERYWQLADSSSISRGSAPPAYASFTISARRMPRVPGRPGSTLQWTTT